MNENGIARVIIGFVALLCVLCAATNVGILVLSRCVASGQDQIESGGAQARIAWRYEASGKNGWFRKDSGKQWIETTSEDSLFQWVEVARTYNYVELFDHSRTMWMRLNSGYNEWRQGGNPRWNRLHPGRWVDVGDLPMVAKRDYRIVLAYFIPIDREPTPDYEQKIRIVMHFVSEVYRQDFEGRGISTEGLRFETQDGQPVVHLIRGNQRAVFYNNAPDYDFHNQFKHICAEIPPSVGVPNKNLIVVFAETYDSGPAKFFWPGVGALGAGYPPEGGFALVSAYMLRPEFCATTVERQKELLFDPTPIKGRTALGYGRQDSPRFQFISDGFGAVAHELGHALGLPHDRRQDDVDVMGNGFRNMRWNFTSTPDPQRRARFSDDNARILYSSRYLASDFTLSDFAPTVQLDWAAPLEPGTTQVKVAVTASCDAGLRAIVFFSPAQDSVVGGRVLTENREVFIQTLTVRPLKPGAFRLEGWVRDGGGNLSHAKLDGTVGR